MPKRLFSFLLLISLGLIACTAEKPPAQKVPILQQPLPGEPFAVPSANAADTLFSDVSTAAGITMQRQDDEKLIGQAWGDYDNDGWLDLYVTDSGGPNLLYHNRGNGTFEPSPLSESVSLPDAVSSGAVFADYDNDGWKDLLVLNVGPDALYHNEGGTAFRDVTAEAGVSDNAHGKSAAWGDFDKDGFLDLYIANWACYPNCPRPNQGDSDRLFHNNGDGTFSDFTAALSRPLGAGFVASFVDFDNDNDLDIYLVNDEFINPIGNVLWRNDGAGCNSWCFTDVSAAAQADKTVMGMGLATGDYDNDGDFDFFFSNAGPMTLLQNQGDGTFADVASQTGTDLGQKQIGWGAVFFDYDNDGWQDLYLAISDNLEDEEHPADALLHNENGTAFTPISPEVSGLDAAGRTLGVAYADYDKDGWLDLVIGNYVGGYQLYRNNGRAPNHNRIAIELVGGGPINRDAVGTRVFVVDSNGQSQMQEVRCGSSLGAGDTQILHFGLGTAELRQVRILWPDGSEQKYTDLVSNRRYRFEYRS